MLPRPSMGMAGQVWGHEPQTDIALMKEVYMLCDVVELIGQRRHALDMG